MSTAPQPMQFASYLSHLPWGLRLAWQAAPKHIVVWSCVLLAQALSVPGLILLSREMVNRLADGFGSYSFRELLSTAALPLIAIALLLLFTQVFAAVAAWLRLCIAELIRDHVHQVIHQKVAQFELDFFESSDSYDLLHRARVDAASVPAQLIEQVGSLLQNGIALLAIAMLLSVYAGWLPLLLIASAMPGLWVIGKYALAANEWRLANTINERRVRYQDLVLTQRETAAEIRLFDLGRHFRDTFARLRAELRGGRMTLEAAELRAELLALTAGWLGVIIGMLWIVSRATAGMVRLGDVVMCYQSFQQGQKLLRTSLDGAGNIYRGLLFLENLRTFLSIKPTLPVATKPIPFPTPIRRGICFENVSFRYPQASRGSLSNLSFEVPAGQIVAIVGDNGAGKSTVLKLLCRYFDPDAGRITIDGHDLRHFSLADLRRHIAVLFQEPLRHHASAAENIGLGNLSILPRDERIRTAAVAAGADGPIARLPQGYDAMLGRLFGGVELSTGEWQRLGLARAYLRDAPIIALDEPTSAMDPWAEADWLARFTELAAGRITLIVTHRFTTAMKANRIYVMQNGVLVETGTHEELVVSGGPYAKSWQQQTASSIGVPM